MSALCSILVLLHTNNLTGKTLTTLAKSTHRFPQLNIPLHNSSNNNNNNNRRRIRTMVVTLCILHRMPTMTHEDTRTMDHTTAKLLCPQVPQQLLPTYQPGVREKEIPSHGTGTGTTAVRNFMLWICLGIDLHCLVFFIVFSPGFLGMSGHHLRTRAESWDQTIVVGIPQSMIRLHLSLKIALFFLDLKTQNELHTILDTILSSARPCLNEMPAFTKKLPGR
jgi:hypothetical protein